MAEPTLTADEWLRQRRADEPAPSTPPAAVKETPDEWLQRRRAANAKEEPRGSVATRTERKPNPDEWLRIRREKAAIPPPAPIEEPSLTQDVVGQTAKDIGEGAKTAGRAALKEWQRTIEEQIGTGEAVISMTTEIATAIASIPAGLWATHRALRDGHYDESGQFVPNYESATRSLDHALQTLNDLIVYEPKTPHGKRGMASIHHLFLKLHEFADKQGGRVTDLAMAAGASEESAAAAGAFTATAIEAIPLFLGFRHPRVQEALQARRTAVARGEPPPPAGDAIIERWLSDLQRDIAGAMPEMEDLIQRTKWAGGKRRPQDAAATQMQSEVLPARGTPEYLARMEQFASDERIAAEAGAVAEAETRGRPVDPRDVDAAIARGGVNDTTSPIQIPEPTKGTKRAPRKGRVKDRVDLPPPETAPAPATAKAKTRTAKEIGEELGRVAQEGEAFRAKRLTPEETRVQKALDKVRTGERLTAEPGAAAIKPITQNEAKIIASEIETGRGHITNLVKRRPDLQAASQEALRNNYGDTITVYRMVNVREGKPLQPATEASSTTTSLKAALDMIQNVPGVVFRGDKTTAFSPTILKYEVPIENVVADMPTIIGMARKSLTKEQLQQMKISGRSGSVDANFLFEEAIKEREVIVNLAGMKPVDSLTNIGGSIDNLARRQLAVDVIEGRFTGGADRIQELKTTSPGTFFRDNAAAAREMDDFAAIISRLLSRERLTGGPGAAKPSRAPQGALSYRKALEDYAAGKALGPAEMARLSTTDLETLATRMSQTVAAMKRRGPTATPEGPTIKGLDAAVELHRDALTELGRRHGREPVSLAAAEEPRPIHDDIKILSDAEIKAVRKELARAETLDRKAGHLMKRAKAEKDPTKRAALEAQAKALYDESFAIDIKLSGRPETVGGTMTELGLGVPMSRQSIFKWQVMRAEQQASERAATAIGARVAPLVEFHANPSDMTWYSMIGTPSNRYKHFGPIAESIINDLNLTETEMMRAAGWRTERDTIALRKIPRKEYGKLGEIFWDTIFEGRPISEILARTDISAGTKEAAMYLRAKMDLDRGSKILADREHNRSWVTTKMENKLRDEGFARRGKRRTPAEMEQLREEAARLADDELKRMIPDTIGIRDYLPHYFPGEWKVYTREVDINGVSTTEFLTSARSQLEAQRMIAEHHAAHPNHPETGYLVKQKLHQDPDLTRVSRPHRWKMINDLAEASGLSREQIAEAARGVIGVKEAKTQWWQSWLKREGYEGFTRDLAWVLDTYNNGFIRHMVGTDLRRRIEPQLKIMRQRGQENLANELEMNMKILLGHKSELSNIVDATLAQTPGVRMIHQPFALERWTNRLKGLQVDVFLKWNPRFHMLNSLQLWQTLWPVVDTRTFLMARKLYLSGEGAAILNQYGIRFLAVRGRLAEGAYRQVIAPTTLEKFKWLAPETSNQELAFLAMYMKGKQMGMLDVKAANYAILRGNLYSQFLALRTDMPRAVYRKLANGEPAPMKSLLFAFTRFGIKDAELMLDLVRSKNVPGAAKWMIGHIIVGGVRGVTSPFLWALSGGSYGTLELYNKLREEYGEKTANLLYYGMPGLLGLDLSYSVQLVNPPFGQSIAEKFGNQVLGPLGGLLVSTGNAALDAKGVEPDASRRAFNALVQRTPSLKWIDSAIKIWTDNYDFTDPAGRLKYQGDLREVLMHAQGFRTMHAAEQELFFNAFIEVRQERDKAIDEAVGYALNQIKKGQAIDKERLLKSTTEWNEMFPIFPITDEDVTRRAMDRFGVMVIPNSMRMLLQGPRQMLPGMAEQMPGGNPITPGR